MKSDLNMNEGIEYLELNPMLTMWMYSQRKYKSTDRLNVVGKNNLDINNFSTVNLAAL